MISLFMMLTSTVLQMPILISVFLIIKAVSLGLASSLSVVMIFSDTILVISFGATLFFTLRFYNIEVPNLELPWSHNQTRGFYFKVLLKIALCSQELYRD